MALQIISVVLFTVFFSEALTLMCYNCNTTTECTQANCSSSCSSMTNHNGNNITFVKKCADSAWCFNSSINLGLIWMSSQCCSSNLCNNATVSENGLSCYTCNDKDCTNRLKCKGGEDHCITATGESLQNTVKGCASKNICDNITLLNNTLPQQHLSSSCCRGNLCNNAQKMTQGPVLLLVPILSLLFYILGLF
ncbi:uncharacterized protein LOC143711818 [Siphateles boraxobius]|uniref:uncharacterized protein LOC143711818 n=1 Tax=Siphateles boraxobius TaxID=180520 RepID=UPI00406399E7